MQVQRDDQYIHKKAKQSGANPELLKQEYDLFDLIEEAKTRGDISEIDRLTRQLIDVQLQQPQIGIKLKWQEKIEYSTIS